MKLVRQRSGSSFFESFSDLIFATMAIFVLLLIIFISQQGDAEARLEFTGSSATTYSLIAHANVYGVPSVVFFPVVVADGLNIARLDGVNDPLLRLAEHVVSEDGLAHLPIEDYVKMAGGFSKGFALGIRSQGEGTIEAALLLEAVRAAPSETAQALKARVFSAGALSAVAKSGEQRLNLVGDWSNRYVTTSNWLQTHGRGDFHSWVDRSRTPVREEARQRDDGRAVVEYRLVGSDRVQVGDTELTAAQFRGFLASIHAGRDFALVQVGPAGAPVVPESWVAEQVLIPSGFTAAR